MSSAVKAAVGRFRSRQKQRGLARVEITLPAEDVLSLKSIAKALREQPGKETPMRRAIHQLAESAVNDTPSFKSLLLDAPLEGLALKRPKDRGRDVKL